MSILKDNILKIIMGASLVIILIVIGLYAFFGNTISINAPMIEISHNNSNASLNLTEQEKQIVNISLKNTTVQNELSGRKYEIKAVNMQNAGLENISSPFERPFVQFVRLNNDGSIGDNVIVYVNMNNNSVSLIDHEQPAPIPSLLQPTT